MRRGLALALAALLCVGACAETLDVGDKGGQVLKMQQALYENGYLKTEADGLYGENTADAVRAFQQDHSLEVTGKADDDTLTLILSDGTSEIRKVQQRLIELGYLTGEADGSFGSASQQAVRLFQQANDLPDTGEMDEATKEALFSDSAKGDTVRMAQTRLIELGYLTGSADGVLGAKTESAIQCFQKTYDLEITGQPDETTLKLLLSDEATALRPELVYKDKGDAVRELQQRLIGLGFLNAGADGRFGENTRTAVRLFQEHLASQGKADGIEADGVATTETQKLLFSEDYSSYIKDVALGDEGFEALRVERQLRNLGYMDATPDETLDEYAVKCVKALQADAGLEVTGVADQATMDALFALDAAEAEHYVPRDVHRGDSGNMVKQLQEELSRIGMLAGLTDDVYGEAVESAVERLYEYLLANNAEYAHLFESREMVTASAQEALLNADLVVYVEDVTETCSASEIARAQRRLNALMYLKSRGIDGDYGKSTRTAIESFQKNNDLPVTGIADEATQRALYSASAIGNWTRYKLEVDITNQRVYAYELIDGQYQKIHDFICSTGLGNSTPTGVFYETTEPLDRWHYFYDFECWAQYAWRVIGPYYFHSVIYSERDESSLRWSSVNNLGSKASHGCIRLEVAAAKWIYENCEAGTIVYIH